MPQAYKEREKGRTNPRRTHAGPSQDNALNYKLNSETFAAQIGNTQ
jgi:hypothetical protein